VVGHVLRHLTGTPDESEAIEADVLAKTLTVEKNGRDLRKRLINPSASL
jgi:hypothetical protein